MPTNKIPVPDSVMKIETSEIVLKIAMSGTYGTFGPKSKRVMNPLLNDKKHLLVDYMREVNMIDESEEFVKPSKYKFNLVGDV